jgi:hypothetical protein
MGKYKEHQIVRAKYPLKDFAGNSLEAGQVGTVVDLYLEPDFTLYEVEFLGKDGNAFVMTLDGDEIESIRMEDEQPQEIGHD